MPKNYHALGWKLVAAWIPPDLHQALRLKLLQRKTSLMHEFTRFVEIYTGHKVEKNEATGKTDEHPPVT
jgi:hypothetical protein